MAGIIGSYLERQLAYAQDRAGHLRRPLVALVRSYGSKAQRSLAEIVADTGLTTAQCEEGLEQLIHLRLVRHLYVPDDTYEVAHDFLAHRILTELTDADEREFKRFRELLATKAAAFVITDVPLTVEEMLMLFKHKERVLPTEAEIRLLLASWLRHESPALYWLLAAPRTVLLPGIQVAGALFDAEIAQRDLASLW